MSNSVFTPAGRALIAACLAGGATLEITELIFADIPGLDPAVAPDPAMTIAPETIVHRAVPTAGLIDAKTAVYSAVIAADAGDFHLNAMALLAGETVVAIAVMPRHLKWATTEFRTGNSLVKNFAIEVADVSGLTGITIPAEAWMYNFDARYAMAEHNHDASYATLVDAANKANKNFNNLELADALANLGFLGTFGTDGYQKLPGGLIIQWGLIYESAASVKPNNDHLFPVTFPTECLALVGSARLDAYSTQHIVMTYIESPSTFRVYCGGVASNDVIQWIALGY